MVCWIDGRPMTITDFGLWNDGGVFRRRLSDSCCGKAIAGMYWYCAVCSEPMMCTKSTMVPTYAEYNPPPASCVVEAVPIRPAPVFPVSASMIDWPWPSSSKVWLPVWVKQVYCWSGGSLVQSGVGFERERGGDQVGVLL